MKYNGWSNKQTWLVNIWYGGTLAEMLWYECEESRELIETDQSDLRERVTYISEECESLSQLPAGLLSDFIATCWDEVDWYELTLVMNRDLADRWAEEMAVADS